MYQRSRKALTFVLFFVVTGWLAGAPALTASRLLQTEIVVLSVTPLNATRSDPGTRPLDLSVDPQSGGTLEFSVAWPTENEQTQITLKATETSATGDLRKILIVANLRLPDGTRVTSERRLQVRESTTAIFEVFRLRDHPLTLGLGAKFVTRTSIRDKPTAGRPVTLHLAIQRVEKGIVIPLETNRMNTMVGEPVTYRFRLGSFEDAPSVQLTMTPTRISGDLLELDVDLTGSLPHDIPELISRREQVVATRATPLVFPLESGDPPSGFRFVVTPIF